ncbi:methylmalonyl Co-A mutase-associated GTPase MeaB [Salipaludibacillus neizhouensis]|uniref:Methylmalonyl Co-A mutase-associated GTPase MeaB n=1 Tax=Salipaludibacillus neizhouensis TaxID=885475 RepID=A0A3A9KBR4_9BACI|nr:methylmalonyl Co-A mutase-associated GTPase MeaB [Salipaludibacillus neizhouensis]RKL67972.1 methylmalonyl Co-A mutase-associated GTPase MeaB [Salipaludibacillus neizhouensis]
MDKNKIDALLLGNQRALAQAISLVEDRKPEHRELMREIYPRTGNAHIIGVTGSPGAGKSTLVNGLVREWRRAGDTVAIIAVDPTSPFSGGALLGDRIRMKDHEEDLGVFIRSMGTRGSLGGLSEACQDTVRLMEAAGFDRIVIETVGVGQSELDIMKTADSIALVLYPSGGDVIQAFKAGIMEIADLFIINKSDLPGVEQLKGELEDLIHITSKPNSWDPPVLMTVSTEKSGMVDVIQAMENHHHHLVASGEKRERRRDQKAVEIERRLAERLKEQFIPYIEETLNTKEQNKETQSDDPYDIAEKIYNRWIKNLARSE